MWAQPWAWLGLIGLAAPVAIHLLARHHAVRTAFPTLRFIDASELNAIQRHRLTDIPLLLVRLLLVALAVAAIAGPRFGSAPAAADEEIAHATVYDMTPSAAAGRSDSFIEGPRRAHIGAESLDAGLMAAAAWASRQPRAREIIVVSDFQRGSISEAAIGRVPDDIGLRFERVPSRPGPLPQGLSIDGERARMTWPASAMASARAIAVVAGTDQAAAERTLAAALSVTPVYATAPDLSVTVVFPKAPEREALAAALQPIDQREQFAVVKTALARWPSRVQAGRRGPGRDGFVVLVDAEPSSPDAVEIISSLAAGLGETAPASESDPRTIPDEQLKRWERAPRPVDLREAGEPQGRWLWMGVVALLGIETWMRRRAA